MPSTRPVDWLLDPAQPAIRYRTLTELLGRPETDAEVRETRRRIPSQGWAHDILTQRVPGRGWVEGSSQYRPKYISTHWMMLVLSDLGLTKSVPTIRSACEYWMAGFPLSNGGVGGNSKGTGEICVVGDMARALIHFGYADDPRVRRSMDWIVDHANPKGGWACWGPGRNLDSWEGLSAFAAYPREYWTPEMRRVVDLGAEYFLSRELHHQGGRYAPWYRFHYPIHYYYDLLVGLDMLTALGYGDDPRLRFALRHLRTKRRSDGRWNLDAVHPDVEGPVARWFAQHPVQAPVPFALETPGRPSKMITLTSLKVLDRVGDT